VGESAHRGGAGPRTEGLSPRQAASVYDRIGRLQDTQVVFEAPALARLTADGRLAEAHNVVEIGCGTGRFACDLLTNVCGPQCRYVGLDVSPRMCRIATARLSRFSARARVMQVDGTLPLRLPAAGADRVVAAFVVDLLPTEYARQLLADTHRVLALGGLLCLASLVQGTTRATRVFSSAWSILAQRSPALLGGCRPVVLADMLDPGCWAVHTDTTVTARRFPAGVLVAERQQ
jgi:ubiquinone/menaquinone biosynthesis C-methylase UbiE